MSIASSTSTPASRATLEAKAKEKFSQGYKTDRSYWNGILTEAQADEHQGYSKVINLVAGIYKSTVAQNNP